MGVPGQGAEDASYSTAVLREWFSLMGMHYSGSAADIFKWYDQRLRPLIKHVLLHAGCPPRVVLPYMDCLDNLLVYNTFAGNVGEPQKHPRGLPQGCPYSMIVVALLMHTWVIVCREPSVTPHVLADKILVTAGGHDHINRIVDATNFTSDFLDILAHDVRPRSPSLFLAVLL